QERYRREIPAHAALASGQARGGGRHAGQSAGTARMKGSGISGKLPDDSVPGGPSPGGLGGEAATPPGEGWFASRGWQPFPFQQDVWQAIGKGESGLLHATTGSGKT